jgi:ribonucleoside-diphosphate reductase alpha chain
VRAKKDAETSQLGLGITGDTAGPANGHSKPGNGNGAEKAKASGGESVPAAAAFTETPPVVPAKMSGGELGPACEQCGGMMQRTGSCYTCSSCGNNTGCG